MDGSTQVCSAALLRAEAGRSPARWEVLARRAEVDGRGQARILLRLVDDMLGVLCAQPAALGLIVVGIGPGTFTGVRIAVATARGLSLALDVPVLGVSSLSALAAAAAAQEGPGRPGAELAALVPVIDARRGQVFYAVYEVCDGAARRKGQRWARHHPIDVCDQGSLAATLSEHCLREALVIGEQPSLTGELPAPLRFVTREVQAEHLVTGQEWLQEEFGFHLKAMTGAGSGDPRLSGAPELVRPIYVRAPDADLHIAKMKDPWADAADRR